MSVTIAIDGDQQRDVVARTFGDFAVHVSVVSGLFRPQPSRMWTVTDIETGKAIAMCAIRYEAYRFAKALALLRAGAGEWNYSNSRECRYEMALQDIRSEAIHGRYDMAYNIQTIAQRALEDNDGAHTPETTAADTPTDTAATRCPECGQLAMVAEPGRCACQQVEAETR